MAGQRQPTNLVLAKGAKHFTKAEIEERLNAEIPPLTDNITAPDYLTKKQKEKFNIISEQLQTLGIMSETDVDALARFIVAQELYIKLTKQLTKKEILENPILLDKYLKNQDRLFKQCRACANDLGLSITSRCKIVVPKAKGADESEKKNKFTAFKKDVPPQ